MIFLILGILTVALIACGQGYSNHSERVTVVHQNDTCDSPDADIACCFTNMPTALTSVMNIAGVDEPGERLEISGTFYMSDGRSPYPDVIVYAYHTNNMGYYAKNGTESGAQRWQGHLHGWCRTDQMGRYRILTIRPAPYPDSSMPAHIHVAIKKPNGQMYWVSDFVFSTDVLVNDVYLSSLPSVGGTGIVDIAIDSTNIWKGTRDIVLTQ